jgi:hypothetical protein
MFVVFSVTYALKPKEWASIVGGIEKQKTKNKKQKNCLSGKCELKLEK